jgi:hypothetical protein
MFSDVNLRIKKRNKILFARDCECIQELRRLIGEQKHITLVLWVFECLQIPLSEMVLKYPDKMEIKMACDLSSGWAHRKVKMTVAKRAILNCHAIAKELEQEYDIALCHAIGQGCSTVHVETHALGLVFYELTAIVIKHKYKDYQEEVLDKIKFYISKLKWYREHTDDLVKSQTWAEFLIREGVPNKEKLLLEKVKKPINKNKKESGNSQESEDESLVPNNKLERLLTLYYNIFMESEEFGLYDEWRWPSFANDLRVSNCTARRYINELIKTGRIKKEDDCDNCYYLRNEKFTSLEEIDIYIRGKEEQWVETGNLTSERRRLLHLIRLIGWVDLFLQYEKILELEINQFYTNKSEKRTVQRDFEFLKEVKSIPLNIQRQKISSKENGLIQWFYVAYEQ